MKRDMELIRKILLEIEASTQPYIQFGDEEARHVALLIDAGWVEATVRKSSMSAIFGATVERLTWEGCNFLDTIRDEAVWKHTSQKVLKSGASWTISVLLEVAKAEIRRHLGLP